MGQQSIHQQPTAGKWRGAVSILEGEQTAQGIAKIEEITDPDINESDTQPNVHTKELQNENHVMLYLVGHEAVTRKTCKANEEKLFKHTLQLLGPK